MAVPRSGDDAGTLAQLIRRSRLLDPGARRHWLRVLPYLTPADRIRLRDILQAGTALDTSGGSTELNSGPRSHHSRVPER